MEQAPMLDRFKWVILTVVGAIVMMAFAYLLFVKDEPVEIIIQPPLPTATHTITPEPTFTPTIPPIEVYVTGAVQNPESRLSLPPGSRVEDAIDRAGGAAENADLSRVNLAQRLQDGDQIHVPAQGETETSTNIEAAPTANVPRLINLNTATVEELETLPDIGASTAQAIVDYREENGLFRSVDELDNVPGIGPTTLEKLRPLVIIDPFDLADEPVPTTVDPASTLINLNTATQEALETLPGIGPASAQAIIAYREENGNFVSVDELDNVPGIGRATIENLRDLVTIE